MIQTLAALLTPTIAAVAIVIAFMQWRTAHQKVVLDLFEKRLAIVEAARAAAFEVIKRKDFEGARKTAVDAALRSRFLFGSDIVKALVEFQGDLYRATGEGDMFEGLSNPGQSPAERREIAIEAARRILKELNTMAEPYMRMDQKLIRTPAEWIRDRNQKRLSYADENQR